MPRYAELPATAFGLYPKVYWFLASDVICA